MDASMVKALAAIGGPDAGQAVLVPELATCPEMPKIMAPQQLALLAPAEQIATSPQSRGQPLALQYDNNKQYD